MTNKSILDNLHPAISIPIILLIITIIVFVGKEILDSNNEEVDSPEAKKSINESKETLDILQKGAENVAEHKDNLDKTPLK